jgi:CubicO group peptidase (beta-lactamase class C family)
MHSHLPQIRRRQFLFSLLIAGAAALTITPAVRAAGDRFAGVPTSLRLLVDQGKLSGAVALVATKDRILHLSAVGQSDLATGRKMRTDDLFWIASMTKPMTAVAVALLADEQKLRFTDPVEKYLPEFRKPWLIEEDKAERRVLVRPARAITIFDLLTHTSGMGGYGVTDPHWTLAEMSKIAAREPLRFPPGNRWGYSTAGIDVLGRIVEIVSGMPFAEFMRRRIFDPLKMTNTTFWLTPRQEQRLARSYRLNSATGKLEPVEISYLYGGAVTDRGRPPLGGSGLFSTAEDVAKFYQLMLHGGEFRGQRILRQDTIAVMTRPQTGGLPVRPGSATGLGFTVITDPAKMAQNANLSAGTFGHGGAYATQSWADPVRDVIYVLMIQRAALPENSDIRLAYQNAVQAALAP